MINRQSFIYIDVDTDSVQLNLEYVIFPVLWNHKGQYGLIPFPRIQNALENWKDTHVGSTEKPKGMFYWHKDLIYVSPQIANALLGEDKDDKCTYNGKSSSQGN